MQLKLNLINTKANIEYDDTWSTPNPDNNLNQINLGVSQIYGDRSKINLDLMRQNTQRRGNKYELGINSYPLGFASKPSNS